MARDLTSGMMAATTAAVLSPILLAFLDFQSGPVRVWTGIGSVTWAGNVYVGLGEFGSVSPATESTDVRANGLTLQLIGVRSDLIGTVLADNYHGRAVKIWRGALNSSGAIIADPYCLFSGRMDSLEVDPGPTTSIIRVGAESVLIDLLRSRERRYTDQDQKIDYPADRGLEYMSTSQSTPFLWGGQNVPAATTNPGIGDRPTIGGIAR